MDFKKRIIKNADILHELHQKVHEFARIRDKSEEKMELWKETAEKFHMSYDRLAFPGGLNKQNERLESDHPQAIERAIQFLEVDPMFVRSGYMKEKFLRRLKRAFLSAEQQERLRKVILARVSGGGRREYRDYCRLARVLTTPEFKIEVEKLLKVGDENIKERAKWLLDAILE